MAVPAGYVAAKSAGKQGRVLLHLAEPPDGRQTLCGRYDRSRFLEEDSHLASERTRVCGQCKLIEERREAQRGRRKADRNRVLP